MLINESTLEVYVKGEGSNNKIDFNQLLFAINFDTIKVELTYLPKKNDKEFTYIKCDAESESEIYIW